jgi:hypothetical protein
VFVVVDMEKKNHQSQELSYINLKPRCCTAWRGCSINISLQRVVGLHNNIVQPTLMVVFLAIVDRIGEELVGIGLAHQCSLMMKITVCPPKEKFSKRHEEGPMESKTHVRESATNQN